MGKKACIVTGGLLDECFLREHMQNNSYDIWIVVDGALELTHRLSLLPDYIVGDFDTVDQSLLEFYDSDRILRHPPEKDQTDTELAIETAMEYRCTEIVLLGATGSRLDHSLANIFLLERLLEQGIHAVIQDASNRLYVKRNSFCIDREQAFGNYFSLLPLTEKVEHVTLTGFKYPVQDMTFYRKYTLGVSNEITGEKAAVEFSEGIFVVVESRDK